MHTQSRSRFITPVNFSGEYVPTVLCGHGTRIGQKYAISGQQQLKTVFDNTKVADPIFLRNLTIYPISGTSKNDFNPISIDEAIHSHKGDVHELDAPDVNTIEFDNRGDDPVLLLDGEEITGALQNRIIALSSVVEARSTKNISVICAEEGRWDDLGGFQTGHCAYPQIRTILAKSLHRKIDTQRAIWNEINRKLTVTKTISTTSSMHDIYHTLNEETARYIEGFSSINHNTVGFIGVAGNCILGCDIFCSAKIYHKFENKLIRSYILDAIEHQKKEPNVPDVKKFFTTLQGALARKKVRNRNGNEKIKGDGFLGQALIYDKNSVHLSVFPT